MAAAGPILSLEMTAKRSEIQMLHEPVARTPPAAMRVVYPTAASSRNGTAQLACSCPFQGISKASSDTYIYAGKDKLHSRAAFEFRSGAGRTYRSSSIYSIPCSLFT